MYANSDGITGRIHRVLSALVSSVRAELGRWVWDSAQRQEELDTLREKSSAALKYLRELECDRPVEENDVKRIDLESPSSALAA